jgi:uncharacterized HAD superfamily protein
MFSRNLTDHYINVITPRLEKPPTGIQNQIFKNQDKTTNIKRVQLLKEKLRLTHIREGADDIRKLCEEYMDIFKLPGDSLTITNATEHSISTPSIPKGRAITLRNSGKRKWGICIDFRKLN